MLGGGGGCWGKSPGAVAGCWKACAICAALRFSVYDCLGVCCWSYRCVVMRCHAWLLLTAGAKDKPAKRLWLGFSSRVLPVPPQHSISLEALEVLSNAKDSQGRSLQASCRTTA
jgi:hypothetical protein